MIKKWLMILIATTSAALVVLAGSAAFGASAAPTPSNPRDMFNPGAILEDHGTLVVVSGQVSCSFHPLLVEVTVSQQSVSGHGASRMDCTLGRYVPFSVMVSAPKGSAFVGGPASAEGVRTEAHAGRHFHGAVPFSGQISLIAPIIDPTPPPPGPTV
jgi:hypothetical protein